MKLGRIVSDDHTKLAFYSLNKLSGIIRTHKDRLPTGKHTNVVYRLQCRDCNASYVGQTSRTLNTRIMEHKSLPKNLSLVLPVVQEHRINCNHEFSWDETKILYTEPSYFRRLIAEMIYIKLQSNGLNAQCETKNLGECYCNILDLVER